MSDGPLDTLDHDDAELTNAADDDQVAAAGERVRRRDRAADDGVRAQMATAQGREFLWGVLGACSMFGHIGGSIEDTYRGLGRRDVGLELWGAANRYPELFLLMQNEAIARATQQTNEARASRVKRRT